MGHCLTGWRRYAVETVMVAGVSLLLIRYVDVPLALHLAYGAAEASGMLLDTVSLLGRGEIYLPAGIAMLAAGFLLLHRTAEMRWHRLSRTLLHTGTLIVGTLAVGQSLVLALKLLVARLRPIELMGEGNLGFAAPLSGAPFTSLPSSHAFTAFAMAMIFSRLVPGCRAVFFGAAMLVAVQRILAQQHFLSDIFISAFLALMVSEAMQAAWRTGGTALHRWRRSTRRLSSR